MPSPFALVAPCAAVIIARRSASLPMRLSTSGRGDPLAQFAAPRQRVLGDRHFAALAIDVHAKAFAVGQGVGQIHFQGVLVLVLLGVAHHRTGHFRHLCPGERDVAQVHSVSLDLDRHRGSGTEEAVGGLLPGHELEIAVEVFHGLGSLASGPGMATHGMSVRPAARVGLDLDSARPGARR